MQLSPLQKQVWMLHIASADTVKLRHFAVKKYNDWPDIPMPPFDVSETLLSMALEKLIYFQRGEAAVEDEDSIRELVRSKRGEYGLTPEGGRSWEEHAEVNWDRFVSNCFCWPDGGDSSYGEWQFIGQSQDLIEEYLVCGKVDFSLVDDLRWDEVCPWQAGYWKTFERACRVRFFSGYKDIQKRGGEDTPFPTDFFTTPACIAPAIESLTKKASFSGKVPITGRG